MLLIDEIDKADIEFPNDLLQELDRMEFFVYETGETVIRRRSGPSSSSPRTTRRSCPDAFLRRCFFHYIKFPDPETMAQIVEVHFPDLKGRLVSEAMRVFYDLRELPGLKKKPSTSELLDWLKLLLNEDIDPGHAARDRQPQGHPAARRRADQKRAGHAPVRAARLHEPPQGRLTAAQP